MAAEKPGQTLQATALVHEAYLRLVDPEPVHLHPVGRAFGRRAGVGAHHELARGTHLMPGGSAGPVSRVRA